MLRKPGGYRKPTEEQRRRSKMTKTEHGKWFRSVWTDVPGASTRDHPAPFPVELAHRLVRMFSFMGDTVIDPFRGTGTTTIAALRTGRNSIGGEIDPDYLASAEKRIRTEIDQLRLFDHRAELEVLRP
jgi:site-specific DNA-methyltransferase (adenine-specific)